MSALKVALPPPFMVSGIVMVICPLALLKLPPPRSRSQLSFHVRSLTVAGIGPGSGSVASAGRLAPYVPTVTLMPVSLYTAPVVVLVVDDVLVDVEEVLVELLELLELPPR